MIITAFSDLHAHPFAQYATIIDGVNSRLLDCVRVLREVIAFARNTDALVFGGDLFHGMAKLDVTALNLVLDTLADAPPAFMLVGNHDQADRASGHHSLHAIKRMDHVVVIDKPGWYLHPRIPGLRVFGVPYTDRTEDVTAALSTIERPACEYAIGLLHAGMDGAKVGPLEYRVKGEMSVESIPRWLDYTLVGHYHDHQVLAERVAYVGATLAHNWGDANKTRGYCVVDLHAGKIEQIESQAPRFLVRSELGDAEPADFVEVRLGDLDDGAKEKIEATIKRRGIVHGSVVVEQHEHTPEARLVCSDGASIRSLIEPYVAHVKGATDEALVELGRAYL